MQVKAIQKNQEDRLIEAKEGETLLTVLARAGLNLDAPCAGKGKCGKCLVEASGELSKIDKSEAETLKGDTKHRLACQTKVLGDVTVIVPEAAEFSAISGLGDSEPYPMDSPLKYKPLPLLNRQDATDSMASRGIRSAKIEALSQLSYLDSNLLPGMGVMWHDELLCAFPLADGEEPPELLAAAIDLGTTGLSIAVIDVITNKVVSIGTALNPQTAQGADVISRINEASESAEQLQHMQDLAFEGLRDLMKKVAGDKIDKIRAAAVSGNTTMLHLLSGVYPKGIAQAPYRPVFIMHQDLTHLSPRLGLSPQAKFLCSPSISAYVGGDITSGILSVELQKKKGTVLYIDIGTNGEIILNNHGCLVGTSCAAGPALEGMNIICGQRATTGAMDSFTMNSDTLEYEYTTLGDVSCTGICGSGLVDICAALIDAGMVHKTGRFQAPERDDVPWLDTFKKDGRFVFDREGKVFLDQKDLRQVQLAKGAIAAAVEMLLARLNLNENDIDEIIIAGSFGFHLKAESLKSISLIPKNYQGPVRFVGNSSLAGSARILLNPTAIFDLEKLVTEVEVVELGFEEAFQPTFLRHLKFA